MGVHLLHNLVFDVSLPVSPDIFYLSLRYLPPQSCWGEGLIFLLPFDSSFTTKNFPAGIEEKEEEKRKEDNKGRPPVLHPQVSLHTNDDKLHDNPNMMRCKHSCDLKLKGIFKIEHDSTELAFIL